MALHDNDSSFALGHYVWPPVWVGAEPEWVRDQSETEFWAADLADVIVRVDLAGGLRARAHRDGMIVFDFSPWGPGPPIDGSYEDYTDFFVRRIRLMNAHLACLYTVVSRPDVSWPFKPTPLTPSRTIRMTFEDDHGVEMPGLDHHAVSNLHSARYARTYDPTQPPWTDSRLHGRGPVAISTDAMRQSFDLLAELLDGDRHPDILLYAELLLRGSAAFRDNDYSAALVYAWTLSEGLIGHLWTAYLDECSALPADDAGFKFMPATRQKWLNGAEMGIRHRIEILSLVGRLPLELYQATNAPRKKRNAWLHYQKIVTRTDAMDSLDLAEDLFEFAEGVRLAIPHNVAG